MKFAGNPLAAAIRGTLVLGSAAVLAMPLAAQAAFVERTGDKNPFSVITSGGEIRSLVMLDVDGDGDLDAVIFHDSYNMGDDAYGYNGQVSTWENAGTARQPSFVQLRDFAYGGNEPGEFLSENPFFGDGLASYSNWYGHPVTIADLSEDERGLIGGSYKSDQGYQPFVYFSLSRGMDDDREVITGLTERSDYDSSSPFYQWKMGLESYGYGTNIAPTAYGNYSGQVGIAVGNLYGNGRGDIVVADEDTLRVFRNDGSPYGTVFNFTQRTGSDNPFYGAGGDLPDLANEAYYGAPLALADLDGDGDLDLVMGNRGEAPIRVFQNTGTASAPQFVERTSHEMVTKYGVTTGYTVPVTADVNGDGRVDVIFVTSEPAELEPRTTAEATPVIRYFENVRVKSDDGFLGSVGLGTLLLGLLALVFRRRR